MSFLSVPQGDLGPIQDNIALNAFRIAINGGLTGPQQYEDFFLDEFEDETGINAGACSAVSYDSTNDRYGIIPPSICTGGTPICGDDQPGNPIGNAFDSNVSTLWVCDLTIGNAGCWGGYHFAEAKKLTSFSLYQSTNKVTSVDVKYSDNGSDWTKLGETVNVTGALDTWETYNPTNPDQSHAYWGLWGKTGSTYWQLKEMRMDDGTGGASGSVLVSNKDDAEANNPVKGRVVLFVDLNSETITPNTDLKAFLSMNNGVNFDQITLEDQGPYESGKRIYSGEGALTARDDKQMVLKAQVLNSKDVRLEGWQGLWKY